MSATPEGEAGERPRALEVAQGFGVMLGGSLAVAALAAGSVLSVARSFASGRLPRPAATLGGRCGELLYGVALLEIPQS